MEFHTFNPHSPYFLQENVDANQCEVLFQNIYREEDEVVAIKRQNLCVPGIKVSEDAMKQQRVRLKGPERELGCVCEEVRGRRKMIEYKTKEADTFAPVSASCLGL